MAARRQPSSQRSSGRRLASRSAAGKSSSASSSAPARRAAPQPARVGGNHVSQIQRARMIAAMVDVAAERGLANATVADVVASSGVSRRTFYEMFDDREDCFLAALDEAVALATEYVREVYAPGKKWRERIRAAVVAILEFLDEEPAMGRLCVVETLGAGSRVLDRRRALLREMSKAIDAGRSESRSGAALPPLTAEGVVGGALSVLHTRLIDRKRRGSLVDLASPLMGMIVLPYLGAAAAQKESERPSPPRRTRRRTVSRDPLRDLDMRLTYRTVRVIMAVASSPGASNREVGEAAGIEDQGQISKLLTRLERLGLIENTGAGQARGAPNAWRLTDRGREVERTINRQTAAQRR